MIALLPLGGEFMEVVFYTTEAGKDVISYFLDPLPKKDLAKVMRDIELLEEYGSELHEPYTKHIDGPIWELRSKFSSNIYRIFYFLRKEDTIVLLHGFTKKGQKTPKSEIELAKKRLQDYENRHP